MGHTTSGVYHVTPGGMYTGYDVYCDMETDGGGWLVIQRRVDGKEDVFRNWDDYERGFGNVTHEHWLGFIYHLYTTEENSVTRLYELRVDLEDWAGETRYAKYNVFSIGESEDNYTLKVLSYSGNAGDALTENSGRMWSTTDKDNDKHAKDCANQNKGSWWYSECGHANLNGVYFNDSGAEHADGIRWKKWLRNGKETNYSLKKAEMKIRRA